MAKKFDFGLTFHLRTAGLVIGYLQLILCAIALILKIVSGLNIASLWFYALLLSVYGSWVYGVHTYSTGFMHPGVIFGVLFYVLSLLALPLIPILRLTLGANVYELIPDQLQSDKFANLGAARVYVLFIICAFVAALLWFSAAVKYSLYKRLKEAEQSNAGGIVNDQHTGTYIVMHN